MPPPAASVDYRTSSDFKFNIDLNCSFNSQNTDCCSFSTGSSYASSSSATSFPAVGRASAARPKPRLVKQRRSSKTAASSSSTAAGAASVDSGINPFRSVSYQNGDTSNCLNNNNNNIQFENLGFVFGGLNSNNLVNNAAAEAAASGGRDNGNIGLVKEASSLHKQESSFCENVMNSESCSTEGVKFKYGANLKDRFSVGNVNTGGNGEEFMLSDELKKLNIDNIEKGAQENRSGVNNANGSVSLDECFVFKTDGGSSVPPKSGVNGTKVYGNDEGVNDGKIGAFGSQCRDDNVFVFGSSGKFKKLGESSSQSSACLAENGVKLADDVLSSSFSFSSVDAELGKSKSEAGSSSGERKVGSSSPELPEGSGVSFSEFKLPNFDVPLSFTANLASKTPESNIKTRGKKDKILKKSKGKLRQSKQTKPRPVQNPLYSEGITQSQEASECYSPMDFSPYEDTTSSNDVPLSTHGSTYQTNVTGENLSDVHPKSVLNDCGNGVGLNKNTHGGEAAQFPFPVDKASGDEEKFTFNSSTSSQKFVSSLKRLQRRKYRMKSAISNSLPKVQGASLDGTPVLSKVQDVGGNFSSSARKDKPENDAGEGLGSEAFSTAEKACEKWRRRGNEAYEKGELPKAEDFYTWGVNCVPPNDSSGTAFTSLVRCYSNRAATRMALGRVREALQDCLMAVKLDPTFHRAQIRAANCYLQLGEVEEAMQCFDKCMGYGNALCLDRKVVISASEGIQKSQKVIECTSRSAELLKLKTSDAAADALQCISEAILISLYSEKLLQMKAQALCMLSRHEEAITLCQKTLDFAEKNHMVATLGKNNTDGTTSYVRLWRYHTLAKCHFHLGNLEVARDHLEKQESKDKAEESSDLLAVTINELLKQKTAGNTAFHSGKHAEAIEHYTSAILSSMESRPFAAICFCNRAAAYQALGQITDAISDCSLAIALDENYVKAVSRRATLHEMIRDYKQAAADLQRLLSLLQKENLEKSKQSGSGKGKELRQVQQRLSLMEEEARREIPLDLYLILGIKKSDTASEFKKAYRKAALRHHPDKAAQSLVKSGEAGEEGRHSKDIAELVHKDSDRLFKMIGEAYAVLSDPTKREEYDDEEEMRKTLKESNAYRANTRRYSDYYSQGYPFERSSSRRYWQDSYKTYSHSHRR